MSIFIIAFCLGFPALALYLKERVPLFASWSPLLACYAAGLLVGNLGLLPESALPVLDGISTGAVALSMPLLLFSVDIRRWRDLKGKTGLAFLLACFAVTLVSVAANFLFRGRVPESEKIAGMLVGVYTGGTPNLAAIKTALDVDMNAYLAVHSADIVLSALYFLFVLTAAKRVFGLFLPAYQGGGTAGSDAADPGAGGASGGASGDAPGADQSQVSGGSAEAPRPEDGSAAETSFTRIFARGSRGGILAALGLDILVVGIGFGLSLLVPPEWRTMTAILAFTSLALIASLSPRVRSIPGSFSAGEYLLFVFCLAVGAMGDFSRILGAAPEYFAYVALVLFGSFLLHALLCALFRVDVDTMLVVSTATINSPPFVGLACVALNNRRLLVPGITAGIVGYAVGNYLGIALANLL